MVLSYKKHLRGERKFSKSDLEFFPSTDKRTCGELAQGTGRFFRRGVGKIARYAR